MTYLLVLIVSYLLGSIPFGLLIGKWIAKVDVRNYGSGNIGMTNVLRTTGYLPAALTLVGDAGKGVLAAALANALIGDPFFSLFAGTLAVVGHNWSIFLGFKGGKGVATIAGMLFTVRPGVALILLLIWLIVLVVFRYISLASIATASALPLVLLFLKAGWAEFILGTVIAVFTVYRHRSNIERLRQGTEYRFGEKVKQ